MQAFYGHFLTSKFALHNNAPATSTKNLVFVESDFFSRDFPEVAFVGMLTLIIFSLYESKIQVTKQGNRVLKGRKGCCGPKISEYERKAIGFGSKENIWHMSSHCLCV